MEELDLRKHGVRVNRLKELDGTLDGLRKRMNDVTARINEILGRTSGRGRPRQIHGERVAGGRARIHVKAGMLAIRYDVGARSSGNPSTRSRIIEVGPEGSGPRWLIDVPKEKQRDLLVLDQQRRILNHLYRTAFTERSSLRRLHGEEKALKGASS